VIKAETGVDVPSEEDTINMETDKVYLPAALPVRECKLEVSCVFR
jgi:hypothetical protein